MGTLANSLINAGMSTPQALIIEAEMQGTPTVSQTALQDTLVKTGLDVNAAAVLASEIKSGTRLTQGQAAALTPRISLAPYAGSGSIGPSLQQAIADLEGAGTGVLKIAPGNYTCDQNIFVRGGAPTLNGGYQGGIEIAGSSMWDTVITFSSGKGFITDCGPAPTHGNNSAMAMIGLRDMKIVGPGKGVADSVGFDCGPQGVYQTTPNAIRLDRIWFDGWENHARFDDTTNLWVTWCYFLNHVKALRFGFNHDTMTVMWNRFGDNQTVIGSQTETALAWDYMSPRFSSGGVVGTVGVAPNAAATLGGAQNHKVLLNWFMRQLLVADIADPSASNIVFEQNQFESCRHYAQLGNVNVTQAPSRVEFKQNTFMRTDGQDETQAKFLFPNTGAGGSLHLIRNVGDSSTGPKAGWVQCGTGSIVEFDMNTLPTAGGYVTEANHLIVGASGKKIVLGSSEKYIFNTVTGGKDKRQFNASGNDNSPDREHWAYNATNSTIFCRWGNKSASTEVLSGNVFDIVQRTINGTRYAASSGAGIPLQGATMISLGADGAQIRGAAYLITRSTTQRDIPVTCIRDASGGYSWASTDGDLDRSQIVASSATPALDCALGRIAQLNMSVNPTIGAPTNIPASGVKVLVIINATAAITSVTWNAAYVFSGGAWTNTGIGTGKVSSVLFVSNGTALVSTEQNAWY